MIRDSKRNPVFATIFTAVGRRTGHLLVEAVQGAYNRHVERAQMRLAPLKLRSWSEIPRAGAHHDCS
jgi:hypothetical protein